MSEPPFASLQCIVGVPRNRFVQDVGFSDGAWCSWWWPLTVACGDGGSSGGGGGGGGSGGGGGDDVGVGDGWW
jgi:hypothetical protein